MKFLIFILSLLAVTFPLYADATLEGEGWHLVSPGAVSATELETLFSNQPNVQSIWGRESGEWTVKFRNAPTELPAEWGTLTQLEANQGYWFRVTGTVFVSGLQSTLSSIDDFNLNGTKGWSLLGAPNSISVIDFFGNILSKDAVLWEWSDGGWSVYQPVDSGTENKFNADNGTNFDNLRELTGGKGLWLNLPNTYYNRVNGRTTYEASCASAGCHGASGNFSNCINCSTFEAFKNKIQDTMPLGIASNCVDQCAWDVAGYIWDELR